jgi:acyl-CoA synthetase (NDP forming)/RimJ/RimL family protein N-acetyltransferase
VSRYPAEWEADVLLADGGVVHLRPVRPDDGDAVRAMHGRLSEETVENRFFEATARILDRDLDTVLAADHDRLVVLVATLGRRVIGVSYYRRSGAGDDAEVAFLIEDAHQGRGLGSIVLEHLAAIARESGVRLFTADMRPGNRAMIGVFREAGFDVEAEFDGGSVRLRMSLTPTPRSREVLRAREHTAQARSVARMLAPRSVAVIGASRQPGTPGHEIFRRIVAAEFTGPTFPVNPAAASVAGVWAYRSIAEVPGPVDVAFVATPPDTIPQVITECAAKGVYALVVLTSGFAETGAEGRARQDELVAAARRNGMRVVGPAGMGIMNTDPAVSLNGTLVARLPARGRVGLFAQSGALSADILGRAVARGIGISVMVSAGNRADVSGTDLLQYWLDDPATDVVSLYLESFGNPHTFARLTRAVSRRKPVVAVQAVAPREHARAEAMFRQAGVIRVDTLGELLDVVTLLSRAPLPAGNRVAIINNIMSLGGIAAASCAVHDLQVAGGQPLDLGVQATVEELEDALRRALADPGVDAVVTAFIPPLRDPHVAGDVIDRLAATSDKPVVVTAPGTTAGGVPTYSSPEEAVRALAHAVRYAAWRALPVGRVPLLAGIDPQEALLVLQESEGSRVAELSGERLGRFLAAYGIRSADGVEQASAVLASVELSDDAVFGRALSFGLAGPVPELVADRSWRALPMTDVDPGRMIRELRTAPLLWGYGSGPTADLAAVEDLLMRVGRLGADLPQVASLQLHVACTEAGCVVVRATADITGAPSEDAPRRLDADGTVANARRGRAP